MIYCGIDWAERAHDVALVDDAGTLVAKRHITDDAAGYKVLLDPGCYSSRRDRGPWSALVPRTASEVEALP